MFAVGKTVHAVSELGFSYNGTASDTVNRSTYTHAGVSLGAEGSDRTVVVLIYARANTTTIPTVSSVTVGGQSATALISSTAGYDGSSLPTATAAYTRALATGTTGDVVVTFSTSVRNCVIHVYSVYGSYTALMTRNERTYDSLNGFPSSLALGIGALWDYGPAIALAYGDSSSPTTNTISGQLTERSVTKPESSGLLFVADTAKTNALSFTTTASSNLSHQHMGGFLIAFMPSSEPSTFDATISTNQVAPNLSTIATGQGWNGTQRLKVTINSGITVSALSVTQSFPGGLHIVNNGNIYGYHGAGALVEAGAGGAGGTALYSRVNTTITNNGNIYGGGGGGGGGGYASIYGDWSVQSGGGGEGGRGQGCTSGTTTVVSNLTGNPGGYAEMNAGTGDSEPWWGWVQGGSGGSGGAWGEIGSAGGPGTGDGASLSLGNGGNGGNSGFCLDGATYAAWRAMGSCKGRVT